jgi:hypothetical protein
MSMLTEYAALISVPVFVIAGTPFALHVRTSADTAFEM